MINQNLSLKADSKIYKKTDKRKVSFMQKALKQIPIENAVIELNNLLATKPIMFITYKEIEEIEKQYEINFKRNFKLNLEEFYIVYLNYCIENKVFNKNESMELQYLKYLFNFSNSHIEYLHNKLAEEKYKKPFHKIITDETIEKNEREILIEIENTLKLPESLIEKISSQIQLSNIDDHTDSGIEEDQFSEEEEKEFDLIAKSLNINVFLNTKTKEQFYKLKIYWAIENFNLPVVKPDIKTRKSEQVHLKIPQIKLYETLGNCSKRDNHVNYRKSKKYYLKLTHYNISNLNLKELRYRDSGTLYLTNERIIIKGGKKDLKIDLSTIKNTYPYEDGLIINRDKGKNLVLCIEHKTDIFYMMLAKLLGE